MEVDGFNPINRMEFSVFCSGSVISGQIKGDNSPCTAKGEGGGLGVACDDCKAPLLELLAYSTLDQAEKEMMKVNGKRDYLYAFYRHPASYTIP